MVKLSFEISKQSEQEALSKYQAILTTARDLVSQGYSIVEGEKSNIYADKCRRKVGNFNYGIDYALQARKEDEILDLKAVVETHKMYMWYTGTVVVDVIGTDTLVSKIEQTWKKALLLPADKINEIIKCFSVGKQHCYGYCKG